MLVSESAMVFDYNEKWTHPPPTFFFLDLHDSHGWPIWTKNGHKSASMPTLYDQTNQFFSPSIVFIVNKITTAIVVASSVVKQNFHSFVEKDNNTIENLLLTAIIPLWIKNRHCLPNWINTMAGKIWSDPLKLRHGRERITEWF